MKPTLKAVVLSLTLFMGLLQGAAPVSDATFITRDVLVVSGASRVGTAVVYI